MPHKSRKKVLITGATGFIGKYIVEQALQNDYEVFVTLRKESDTTRIAHLNFQKILIDFSSEKTINASFSSNMVFDTVIHNAGVKTCIKKDYYYKYNAVLTRNLCAVLHKRKMVNGRVLFISSLAALGPGNPITFADILENKTENPISHYGRSKLLAEKDLIKSGLNYVILRPTAVYGEGTLDYKDLIKAVKKGLAIFIAKPYQRLSFIHAEDVAKIIFLTDKIAHENQIFNVSDGIDYSLESFYEILSTRVGVPIKFRLCIPFFAVKGIAKFNELMEGVFKIQNALNSVEKANEVTALNWRCSAKKLIHKINFTTSHSLIEIMD